ncbi:DUF3718 domain-containing protein [Colwellia sp. 1_MG-2023]|uniref:DUF3718 domain-containing protein n=1 Tax=Colwellia sp. 1_MG-2023 TaxID=3062649 RepID=UPI0026E4240F|nr:DUF3718 domain-containing protein [Colwellia sp. 1_MG-2023]MDO6446831.1 DUF3718 domain-containing protein [Colwellia sp. 1_MG-2023]
MKSIIAAITFATLSLSYTPQAEASNIAQNLCDYVNVDNKSKLRSYLKSNKLKIRNVFDSISCNGQNLLEFAAAKNSTETGSMIIGKLSKKVVSSNLASIASTELALIAEKRVSS